MKRTVQITSESILGKTTIMLSIINTIATSFKFPDSSQSILECLRGYTQKNSTVIFYKKENFLFFAFNLQ